MKARINVNVKKLTNKVIKQGEFIPRLFVIESKMNV